MGDEMKMGEVEEACGGDNRGDEERVLDWEVGLPGIFDLTPLSQSLISKELASAFSISPEPCRTILDVNRASQNTLSIIRGGRVSHDWSSNDNFKSFAEERSRDPIVLEVEEATDPDGSGSGSQKLRKIDYAEEADSALGIENCTDAKALRRPRLVWNPQLHKRFVEVVEHLGIKNAVPKNIMQMMNVEGLSRENVASHLQKYRLYLKRMKGISSGDEPSSTNQPLGPTPVQHGGARSEAHMNGHLGMPIPMNYPAPSGMMPMPVYGHIGMQAGNQCVGYGNNNPYNMMHKQRDWSGYEYNMTNPSYHTPVAPSGNN